MGLKGPEKRFLLIKVSYDLSPLNCAQRQIARISLKERKGNEVRGVMSDTDPAGTWAWTAMAAAPVGGGASRGGVLSASEPSAPLC